MVAVALLAVVLAAVVVALRAGSAHGAAADAQPPAAVRLDDGWRRVQDPGDTGLADGRSTGGGDGWVGVTVPDVTQPLPTPASYAGSIWWYARQLTIPAAGPGDGWALRFDGVRRIASVYVDGRQIAGSDDPYSPFEAELPADLTGRTVTVAVRVDGRRPEPLSEGWWNWTGIVRPVHLVPRGRLNTIDPAIQGQATCSAPGVCQGSVRIRAAVDDRTSAPVPASVRVTVQDPTGAQVAAVQQSIGTAQPGTPATAALDVPLPAARLWSPADPALYTATVEVLSGDGTVEQRIQRQIGVRSVTVAAGRLLLNGEPLRLRGESIQEDLPGRGAALSDADVARIVQDLEDAGANVARAHYTLDERLLSALDRAGIMVWSEAPVYQGTVRMDDPAYVARMLRTNQRAVIASRNHPSVIVHSVANELSPVVDRHAGASGYLTQARADVQSLDPTVPPAVDLVSYPGYPAQRAYAQFPVLGLNVYFGWYTGRPGRHSTAKFSDLAPFLARSRRMYFGSAQAITEMGAEGVHNGSRDRKGTLQFQAAYLARLMTVIDRRPDLSGAMYWTLREFAIKPGWTGGTPARSAKRDGIHRKGLLTYAGKPKPAWRIARVRLDGTRWSTDPSAPLRSGYGH